VTTLNTLFWDFSMRCVILRRRGGEKRVCLLDGRPVAMPDLDSRGKLATLRIGLNMVAPLPFSEMIGIDPIARKLRFCRFVSLLLLRVLCILVVSIMGGATSRSRKVRNFREQPKELPESSICHGSLGS